MKDEKQGETPWWEGESKANCKKGIRVNQRKKEGLRGVQEKRISYTVLTTFQLILIVEVSNSIAKKWQSNKKVIITIFFLIASQVKKRKKYLCDWKKESLTL